MAMKRLQKHLLGVVTGAALLASAGIAQAQDAADADSPVAGMSAQQNMQYCVPGCVAGPITGTDMHHGMMGQDAMPMMMAPGMMGQGMMMPMMVTPGTMGQGTMPMMMAPGTMGQGMMGQSMMGEGTMNQSAMPMMGAAGAPLGPDNVRPHLEHRLTMMGLPNLMLGSIEEQDNDTLIAEIMTRDGTLVQRLAIDRHSGAVVPLE